MRLHKVECSIIIEFITVVKLLSLYCHLGRQCGVCQHCQQPVFTLGQIDMGAIQQIFTRGRGGDVNLGVRCQEKHASHRQRQLSC